MAVCAQENAFCGLGPDCVERPRQASVRKSEVLRAIAMMELERAYVSAIAADIAASASFGDEDLLQAPPATCDRLRTTAKAPVDAAAFQPELGWTVPSAVHESPVRIDASHTARIAMPRSLRAEVVLAQPVTYCRLAQVQALGDFPNT
jgi:hypothetical protein